MFSGITARTLAGVVTIFLLLCGLAPAPRAQGADWSTLRVAFYPAVPERRALFYLLEREFERLYPGLNVELVETYEEAGKTYSLADTYYEGGIAKVKADIYEVDTILLSDLVGRLQSVSLPFDDFAPAAVEAVRRNNETYAVPHWLCGNFLYYSKRDADVVAAVEKAETWPELVADLVAKRKRLMVDLSGRSTLGEWYLTAYADLVGLGQAQKDVRSSKSPDSRVVAALSDLVSACEPGFCRDSNLHRRSGYYARAFVRGQADVYVGYSESIHYGLRDALENCLMGQRCLREDEIGIRPLPAFFTPRKGGGVGWVDGLAIDAQLKGIKLAIAREFIKFVVSEPGYRLVLVPEGEGGVQASDISRYLLPARQGVVIDKAPLYPMFVAAHGGRGTGMEVGLNDALRAVGSELNRLVKANPPK